MGNARPHFVALLVRDNNLGQSLLAVFTRLSATEVLERRCATFSIQRQYRLETSTTPVS